MDTVVIGGGTGTNAILPVFANAAGKVTYVVPISDNGGSTSEILRVLGGPAIGDARSRLVRLMPAGPLKTVMEHRLPADNAKAHYEWTLIVEGRHPVWEGMPQYLINMYRAFLIRVNSEILLRNRAHSEFEFGQASVGNLLISGARTFFGSLDSALEFVKATSGVEQRFSVLPAMSTNFTHHIAAELDDGSSMVGQTEISHPSHSTSLERPYEYEDSMPFNHPSLSASQISFSKESTPLPSRLARVFYINPMGHEIQPKASSRVLEAARQSQAVVYSVGSLFTSILPIVLLNGLPQQIAAIQGPKVFILNGSMDRETTGMDGYAVLEAVAQAFAQVLGSPREWTRMVTHFIYPAPSATPRDAHAHPMAPCSEQITKKGVTCIACRTDAQGRYDLESLEDLLNSLLSV